jgi:hypothetical protein
MDLEKIFYEIVSERKKPQGVFILRNGLMIPVENMIYWDWGFPKWPFLQCRINVIYDNKEVNLLYYPNGKINITGDNQFDIVNFIEADEVDYVVDYIY